MKKVLVLISLCTVVAAQAQQLPMYSQYLTNDYIINPAVAGSKSYYPLQINSRNQWSGLGDISPKTNTLSYHMPIAYNDLGVGAIVAQDQTGPYSQIIITTSFAYHLQLDDQNITRLSLGLSGTMTQHTLKQDDLTFHTPEPVFQGSYSKTVPDASFGAYLYSNNFTLTLSAHQLFESTFKDAIQDFFGDNTQVRHYFAHISYIVDIYSDLAMRTSKSIVAFLGLKLGDMFLSYSYDYGINSLSTIASGSQEVTIGYNINDKRKRRHSYYW